MIDARGAFWGYLLDRPSVTATDRCVVCGAPASDAHHVIEKGIGGTSGSIERRIPKLRLCGMGNASGCHGLVHQMRLHLYWREPDGWVWWLSPEPMPHEEAWRLHRAEYAPIRKDRVYETFGGTR